MARYCITAAKSNDEDRDLKTDFKLWKYELRDAEWKWVPKGWKRTGEIAALLEDQHEVLTAKQGKAGIRVGATVELELRISDNDSNYKISEMPDD